MIKPYIASDGHKYVTIDNKACVGCLRCENVCPVVNENEYSSNSVNDSIPYAAYSKDDGIYSNSTSGGLFASLAIDFIRSGGYVCGVVMENNNAKHIITDNEGDVAKMQGSKYIQSDTKGLYSGIDELLKLGKKVLFCGMGCQAAAVCSFFRKSKYRESLFVIDMICGGVPSQVLVNKFIASDSRYRAIVGFRNKGKYVLTCLNNNGKLEQLSRERPLPLYGFFSGLTNRYSCGDCKFAGVERASDITIGDYWGDNSDIHKSVAIVHSPKGDKLLKNSSNLEIFKTDWRFLNYNYRAIIGKTYNNIRWQRKLMPWLFKNLSYKNICGFYGCHFRNPLLFLIFSCTKIESMLIRKFLRYRQVKIVNNIMKKYDKVSALNWFRGG